MAKDDKKTDKKIVLDEGRELPQTNAQVKMPVVKPPKDSKDIKKK